jgi:hypothetical protein
MNRCFLMAILLWHVSAQAQNAGIGTDNPDKAAQLQIHSTTRGLLIPRLSTAQMNAINLPATGLLIYNTSTSRFRYNSGTAASPVWQTITTTGDAVAGYGAYWVRNGNDISTGVASIGTTDKQDFVWKRNETQVARFSTNTYNVILGLNAGIGASGADNVAIGRGALGTPNNKSKQVAIGDSALFAFTSSALVGFNTAVGFKASQKNNLGNYNTAVGAIAMQEGTTASNNTALGFAALRTVISGNNNTAVGVDALRNVYGADNHTAIGFRARPGSPTDVAHDDTWLGANATTPVSLGSLVPRYSTTIGAGAEIQASAENTIRYGNDAVTKWAFGRTTTDANVALQVGTTAANGNGAYLGRTGTWHNSSDRNKKQDFSPVNGHALLQQLMQMPVSYWQYKGNAVKHIGPTAQDFFAAFRLSNDEKAINTVDAAGVSLAIIKTLLEETMKLDEEVKTLEKR